MRILMTAGTYGRYGISTVIKNLAVRLVKLGNDVTIGAFSFSEKPPDDVQSEKLSSPMNWTRLNQKYDIIHSHQPVTNFLVMFSKIPFLYEYYGSPHSLFNPSRVAMELSLKLIKTFKKKIVAISHAAAHDLMPQFKQSDVDVVPLGVDLERFNHTCDKRHHHGTPHLLFAGHLHPHKRVNDLISAMKELVVIYPEAYLQIVGSGAELPNLQSQVARLGLTRNVGFSGWVTDDELPFYYSSCDIYVSASEWEMFGLPLLEAMACGKPVVASCIPAHRELIHRSNAGILYNIGDTRDLVKKICKAYEEKDSYKHRGLLFAKMNDWSVVTNQVLKIYVQMLNGTAAA